MNEKINNELIKIQDELEALDNAVKQIQKAESIASSVVKGVNELQGKYANQLEFIQKQVDGSVGKITDKADSLVNELTEKHTKQLEDVSEIFEDYHKKTVTSQNQNNDLIKRTIDKTDSQIYQLSSSHNKQIEEVQGLLENYLELAQSTATLTEDINKINFPTKLSNLENAAKQLNQVQVQLKDDFQSYETTNAQILKYSKKTKKRATTTLILSIVGVVLLVAIGLDVALKYWPNLLDFLK